MPAKGFFAPLVDGLDLSRSGSAAYERARGPLSAGVAARPICSGSSFTGVFGHEVDVAADDRPIRRGGDLGKGTGRSRDAVVYGTQAMHVLRAEKGYIIVGQDTDGTMDARRHAGLGWAIGKSKPDFIGRRSLAPSRSCRRRSANNSSAF